MACMYQFSSILDVFSDMTIMPCRSVDPESLAAVSKSLVATILTSSLEAVGVGMSLDVLGPRTPFFALSCSSRFST